MAQEQKKYRSIYTGSEIDDILTRALAGVSINGVPIIPENRIISIIINAEDVGALPNNTKFAAGLDLSVDPNTFVMTVQLLDQDNNNIGSPKSLDLPLEELVVSGSYNSSSKKIVLTLRSGDSIEIPIGDLISGLQAELSASNKLNPAYIDYDSTHRAVSDTEKSAWNSKQSALTTVQLEAVNSGITDEDVAQIETNKNNISLINATLSDKVDKEEGKGLSTNDYTNSEKTKLDSLAEIKTIGTGLNLDANGELAATGGSGGTDDYEDLINQPQINGNTLLGNKTSAQLGLASASDIPTTLAELSGDSTHRTVTDAEKNTWDAKADMSDIPTVPIKGIEKNNTAIMPDASGVVNITVPTTAAEVSALPDSTLYGASISLSINTTTYVLTTTLKDQNGNTLGTAQTIDLPLESVVVDGSYNDTTKKVVLTLQNGNAIEFSIADLVAGLQSEITSTNKLDADLVDDSTSTNKFVTSAEKSAWNNKSNLELGTTSTTAYRGDRGQTAYVHATDSNRLTTAKPSGLYKISTTAEGHVASATSVEKFDITSLGIPSQDNTYTKSETNTLLNNHFVEGDNIEITNNQDGTQTISATGGSTAPVKAYFGYVGDDRYNTFYADAAHTIEIPLEDNALYIDMTNPTQSGFVLFGRNLDATSNSSLIPLGRPYSESSWSVVPGDKGYTAYYHATDSSRVTTAQPSGFYKIAATSEGHIASLTNVTKTDITDLGIPAQDTTYESKSAVSGGTAVSLVTTGEKYTWNHKASSSDIPSASSASPKMNGTASSGSSSYWSRADHIHPTDTSRQAALTSTQLSAVNSGVTSTVVSHANSTYSAVIPSANSAISNGDLSSITTNECRIYHNPSNLPNGTTGSVICTTRIFDSNTGYQDLVFITSQGNIHPTYRRAKTGGFWRSWSLLTNT